MGDCKTRKPVDENLRENRMFMCARRQTRDDKLLTRLQISTFRSYTVINYHQQESCFVEPEWILSEP